MFLLYTILSLNSFNFLFYLNPLPFQFSSFLLLAFSPDRGHVFFECQKVFVKFSHGFCGRRYLKVCFSLWVAQILSLPFCSAQSFHIAPHYCFLEDPASLRVCQQRVWYALPKVIHSQFCVGFHNDLWFAAEVSTSYLFFLFLSPLEPME